MKIGERIATALKHNGFLNGLFGKADCEMCRNKTQNYFSAHHPVCATFNRKHEGTLEYCDIKNESGRCLGYSPVYQENKIA
jgi:hypothetical protein